MKEKWLQVIRRKDFHPAQSSVVRSEHFELGKYRVPQGLKLRALLKPDAMPTLFPSYPSYLLPVSHHAFLLISLLDKILVLIIQF